MEVWVKRDALSKYRHLSYKTVQNLRIATDAKTNTAIYFYR